MSLVDTEVITTYKEGVIMRKIQTCSESRMTRRSVLCGALVTATLAATRTVRAQQMQTHLPPRVAAKPKGPLVFLDYDKDEIDFAYDQAPWAPNASEISKRNAQKSAAALARLGPPRRVAYGSAEIEKLDIYVTKQPNAPKQSAAPLWPSDSHSTPCSFGAPVRGTDGRAGDSPARIHAAGMELRLSCAHIIARMSVKGTPHSGSIRHAAPDTALSAITFP